MVLPSWVTSSSWARPPPDILVEDDMVFLMEGGVLGGKGEILLKNTFYNKR